MLPLVKHNARKLPGWNDHVKHEREQSLFIIIIIIYNICKAHYSQIKLNYK